MDRYQLHHGDCFEFLKTIEPNSVDSIVTDPPAGIGFFGKDWDKDKGGRDKWIEWMQSVAAECFRALKPGGYALVWSLPRTSHWTGMAWENAGFYPQDKITHVFGCGFPKSFNIPKAFDKAAGVEREAADLAKQWEGSGTTGVAAMLEGFRFVGVDMEKEYVDIAKKRIEFVLKQGTLF